MTGQSAINESAVILGEGISTLAQQQPMLLGSHCRRAMDEIARRTWSLKGTVFCDIVNGQMSYTLPTKPYRDSSMQVKDPSGQIWPLSSITPEEADGRFWNWRSPTNAYQGIPSIYLPEGLKTYKLLPVPNYSISDGLQVSGYLGVDDWYDIEQESPLQEGTDEAVVLGICYRRCREMQKVDPSYAPLYNSYKNDFEVIMRRLYRESLSATEARRGGIVPSRGNRFNCMGGGYILL